MVSNTQQMGSVTIIQCLPRSNMVQNGFQNE